MLKGEEVPVPLDAHAYSNGKVMHLDKMQGGGKNPKKILIGKLLPNKTAEDGRPLMNPNNNYFTIYKDEYTQEIALRGRSNIPQFPPDTIHVGLFALVLALSMKLGIYQLLIEVYNEQIANAIMDLVMYFIYDGSNSINVMASKMNYQLMFSIKSYSESWYSQLFGGEGDGPKLTDANNHEFMRRWTAMQVENGLSNVMISLDGTNDDCRSKTNSEARFGEAKSHNNVPIVGAMVVVIAEGEHKGMPLAYFITPGNKPDMVTSKTVLTYLYEYRLNARGLVADRGFCNEDVMALCDQLGLPFLIMMKSDFTGFKMMYAKHSDDVYLNYKYWLPSTHEFGITEDNIPVFGPKSKNPDRKGCVGLFLDRNRWNKNANEMETSCSLEYNHLRKKLDKFQEKHPDPFPTVTEAEQALKTAKIVVSDKFKSVISIVYNIEANYFELSLNTTELDSMQKGYGWAGMVSSKSQTAQEMSDGFKVRHSSEDSFNCLKSQLGFDVLRVSGEERYHTKFFCGFIALIIRTEIKNICVKYETDNKVEIDVNKMIQELDNIGFKLSLSSYVYSDQISGVQRDILGSLGIDKKVIELFSPLVNARENEKEIARLRGMQREILMEAPLKKPGRPKGSKNKKSATNQIESKQLDEKDNAQSIESDLPPMEETSNPIPVKSHRGGRKKGSKNKKTLLREAEQAAEKQRRINAGLPPEDPKPKRGRPPGAKNKKTLLREAEEAAERERRVAAGLPAEESKPEKQHIGRIKGTKNKKTLIREAEEQANTENEGIRQEQGSKSSRIGTQYRTTKMQDDDDRKLSELTGIDIIGNPPPRPWTRSVRQHEKRRRDELRKKAKEKLKEMRAVRDDHYDQ